MADARPNAWPPIVLAAQYVDASLHGGPVTVTLASLAIGLIPVGILQAGMFKELLKDKKLDEMIAKNEELWAKSEERRAKNEERTQANLEKIMNDLAAIKDNGEVDDLKARVKSLEDMYVKDGERIAVLEGIVRRNNLT